ncbi:hypothetical protein SDRG_14979 [Saprolegnia diclina VS20]|uniref:Kinesin motor domain-containing protein n=1 Tax=Saprolegnia diclina (strain VS20) TaxID=1156394 RepID=T0PY42_SAPDV|nr:hypothetical protein SDRG_14979 [Saprolegnia diclina VS20]EQC27176.1 hypothetical protein SDRG_14979 [Saprolegnia diclina VS20]|eukprot:XP_008619363.1 hypothetical protein SDRG_14979 [Saprolegnia diclina VS20]
MVDDVTRGFRVLLRLREPPAGAASVLLPSLAGVSDGLCLAPDEKRVLWAKHSATKALQLDGVFPPDTPHAIVYDHLADYVGAVLSGRDCSIVAYGQKGSGKTHTMSGGTPPADDGAEPEAPVTDAVPDDAGLVPRLVHALFNALDGSLDLDVHCSCLEISNEKVYDLLVGATMPVASSPPRRMMSRSRRKRTLWNVHAKPTHETDDLPVLTQANGATLIEGLSAHAMKSRDDVLDVYNQVAGHRSKRLRHGHVIFQVTLQPRDPTRRASRLFLVDLAGMDVAPVQHTPEVASIHKSLSNLSQCVHALAQRRALDHVPYRASVLTRLLQPSLEAAGRTTFVLTVTPAAASWDETCTTLRLAERLKGIESSDVVRREILPPMALEARVAALEAENTRVRALLEAARTQLAQATDHEKTLATENDMLRSHIRASEAMLRRVRLVLTNEADDNPTPATLPIEPDSHTSDEEQHRPNSSSSSTLPALGLGAIPEETLPWRLQKKLVTIPLPLRVQECKRMLSATKRAAKTSSSRRRRNERPPDDNDVCNGDDDDSCSASGKLPVLENAPTVEKQPAPPRSFAPKHRGRSAKTSARKADEVQLPQLTRAKAKHPVSFQYAVLLDNESQALLQIDDYKAHRRVQLEATLEAPPSC